MPVASRGPTSPTGFCAAFLTQVMTAGVFHADPHPGNILIDPLGTLWLIDFGAVGLIDPVTMEALQLMGAGLATGQPALLAGRCGRSQDPAVSRSSRRPWRPSSAGC